MGKYLGIPSIHGRLKNDSFVDLISKVQGRLAGWKTKTLSLAGRIVLAQSVLAAIPYYSMQTTLLPIGVIKAIEQQIRNFIWGSSLEQRKCHLIRWDIVTTSKECGGLGIRKLEVMNRAFLAKIGWRVLRNDDSLLALVLRAKYAATSPDCAKWHPRQAMSNAWKGVIKAIPILQQGGRKLVRNGRDTSFWNEIWIGDTTLLNSATSLVPESEINKPVAAYWTTDQGWDWNKLITLLPPTSLNALAGTILDIDQAGEDVLTWKNEGSGIFTVRSAYHIADGYVPSTEAAKWNSI